MSRKMTQNMKNVLPFVSPRFPKTTEMGKQMGKQITKSPVNRWGNNNNI